MPSRIDKVLAAPDRAIVPPDAEREVLERLGTGPAAAAPTTVVALVDAAVRADPGAPLVIDGDDVISYGAADVRIDAMAAVLADAGVGPGTRVGVCVPPGADLVLVVLAVLRCGAAYVPVSPADPATRRDFVLAQAGVTVVVRDDAAAASTTTTDAGVVVPLSALRTAPAAPRRAVETVPDDEVYVMFTSGTTGRPKGVALTHGGVANLIAGLAAHAGLSPAGTALFHTSVAFDASVSELLLPAATGMAVAVARDGMDLLALAETIERHGVTLVSMVPSVTAAFLELVADRDTLRTVTTFLSVGEALPPRVARRFHEVARRHGSSATLENMYGPTETSVFATGRRIGPDTERVTLGRPLAGVRIRVLDPAGTEPVAVGVAGEICIGGAGVAPHGYIGRPELTASQFVTDPDGDGPLYRTGDIGRWLPTGDLDYLGRRDDQVKIRGQRIELGEIEEALALLDGVRAAGCCVRTDGAVSTLHAFVVTDDGAAARRAPDALAGVLPARMLPATCTRLDALPLNANGKLDRSRLAGLVPEAGAAGGAPLTSDAERDLGAVVARVLDIAVPGADDSLLSLGGDSLTAVRVVAELRARGRHVELVELLAGRTLRECAESSGPAGAGAPSSPAATGSGPGDDWERTVWIAPADRATGAAARGAVDPARRGFVTDDVEAVLPLTAMQAGIVVTAMRDEDSTAFVVQQRYDAGRGRFRVGALRAAVASVVADHPALRVSVLPGADGEAVQIVRAAAAVPVVVTAVADDDAADALLDTDRRTPFSLEEGPLLRVRLVESAAGQRLVVTYHHVILDGWSQDLVVRDLVVRHDRHAAGEPAPAAGTHDREAAVRRYGAAVLAMVRSARTQDDVEARAVGELAVGGREGLAGTDPEDLGTLVPSRNPLGDPIGSRALPLGPELTSQILTTASRLGVTPSAVVESAWATVFAEVTGTRDVLYGKVVTQRGLPVPGIAEVVGPLINTVPARTPVDPDVSVADLVSGVHAASTVLLGRAHARLADVLRRSGLSAQALGSLYLYEGTSDARREASASGIELWRASTEQTGFDVTLLASETDTGLLLTVLYDGRRFGPHDAGLLLRRTELTLASFVADPGGRVGDVPTMLPEEVPDGPEHWAAPQHARVDVAFRRIASSHPGRCAVVQGDLALDYAQLDDASDAVAALLATRGIAAGRYVGLPVRRDVATLVTLLGIVKAGAAYVPLDPALPDERLRMMTGAGGIDVIVVADDTMRQRVPDFADAAHVIDVRDAWPGGFTAPSQAAAVVVDDATSPEGPVAVFHTSGTTGRPKGVVVPHRAVVRLVVDADYVSLSPGSVVLHAASLAFDAATFEIWGAWLNGGSLVLLDADDHLDPVRLRAGITEHGVTHMWLTASLFNLHVEQDPEMFDGVAELLVGGEKLSEAHIRRLHEHNDTTAVVNGYGPTETTTFAATHRIERGFGSIPIGSAVPRTGLHVVRDGREVGTGIPGELWVTGDGVALGYLADPERTAERFRDSPFGSGLVYRTGDLVRRDLDGTLDFLGRLDDQVKIRGYRVEPGEVVAALEGLDQVRRAAVVARSTTTGANELVAFVVGPARSSTERLREQLGGVLPGYAVPARIQILDQLPLTATGKVDRAALLAHPDLDEAGTTDVAPAADTAAANDSGATRVEQAVVAAYTQALGTPAHARTPFFEAGGDSLKAMRIVHLLRSAGYDTSVRAVLAALTPQDLAVTARVASGAPDTPLSDAGTGPRPLLRGVYAACAADPRSRAHNVPFALVCDGRIDPARLAAALTGIVERHPALRARIGLEGDVVVSRTTPARPVVVGHVPYQDDIGVMIDAFARPFRLDEPPLLRAAVAAAADHDVVLLDVHHIAFDGTSLEILLDDLATAFSGTTPGPAPIGAGHPDRPDGLDHWLDVFDTLPPSPLEFFDGAGDPATLGRVADTVPEELRTAVDGLAARQGVTPFVVYAAAVAVLLQRYTMHDDVVVGIPVDLRDVHGRTGEVGMWVNILPLRLRPREDLTLGAFLAAAREAASAALDHAGVPLPAITSALAARHRAPAGDLVQVALAYRDATRASIDLGDLHAHLVGPVSLEPKFGIEFTVERSGSSDAIGVEYRASVVDKDLAQLLLDHLVQVVTAFTENLDRTLADIDLL